jgi:hypothetical protein
MRNASILLATLAGQLRCTDIGPPGCAVGLARQWQNVCHAQANSPLVPAREHGDDGKHEIKPWSSERIASCVSALAVQQVDERLVVQASSLHRLTHEWETDT